MTGIVITAGVRLYLRDRVRGDVNNAIFVISESLGMSGFESAIVFLACRVVWGNILS